MEYLGAVLIAFVGSILIFILYDIWCHTYFWRHGLPGPRPSPIFGNALQWRKGLYLANEENIKKYGKIHWIYSFRVKTIVVADPDFLREIMIKSFPTFINRRKLPVYIMPFHLSLIHLRDQHWKDVRHILTPTFSTAKIKKMSMLVGECCDSLVRNFKHSQETNNYVELGELFGYFTLDTIAVCAFGMKVDSQRNPDHPLIRTVRKVFHTSFEQSPEVILSCIFPALSTLLTKVYLSRGSVGPARDFMINITKQIIKMRKESTEKEREDFLQLLLNAESESASDVIGKDHAGENGHNPTQNHAADPRPHQPKQKRCLTTDEMIGQISSFILAGYETTKATLGFVFYLLATHPDIQEKLISEIDDAIPSRDHVDCESVSNLSYLDMIVMESMRLYPPISSVVRHCDETFQYGDITIKKGMEVMIPIYSIHHDADLWPDPETFDPERFSKENRQKQRPMTWLPFGSGPRTCIGMRFALMEAKMAIVRLLQMFRFKTAPQTQIPLDLGDLRFMFPKSGITLRVEAR